MQKETPESLDLSAPPPRVTRYKRKLIRNICVTVGIFILVSVFYRIGQTHNPHLIRAQQNEEEEIHRAQVPQLYQGDKTESNTPKEHDKQKASLDGETEAQNNLASNQKETKNNIKNDTNNQGKIGSTHNKGLLQEYFEQQELIKIKEENNARLSSTSFFVEGFGSKGKQDLTSLVDKALVDAGGNTNKGASFLKQNAQESKLDFISEQGGVEPDANKNSHKLKAGSIIPCALVTALNSDLPGTVVARVRENIFDTDSGSFLLIPQGATLVGKYNSNVSFGQERAQVIFQQITFPPSRTNPHGYTVQIDSLQGSDLAGHTGLADRVNHHYDKIAVGITLSSLLAAAGKEPDSNKDEVPSYRHRAILKIGENISDVGKKFADKMLDQQPTITIKGGTPFNVMIASDLNLLPYFGESS